MLEVLYYNITSEALEVLYYNITSEVLEVLYYNRYFSNYKSIEVWLGIKYFEYSVSRDKIFFIYFKHIKLRDLNYEIHPMTGV